MATSTITLQSIVDAVMGFADIEPVLNVGGYSSQPALTIANDVMSAMLAKSTPWKWNRIELPPFYTNSFQQDYALINANGSSVTNLAWIENAVVIGINSTAIPKPWATVEVERDQIQSTTSTLSNNFWQSPMFTINWRYNRDLYYGTWGASNTGTASFGNNPQAGSVYTPILGTNSQPQNPISQIQDANGNLLVLTTYGTTGNSAPSAPPNSAPGTTVTDGTVVWTVVDPDGAGIRVFPVPSATGLLWQFRMMAQATPPRFTSLSQVISPIPDRNEPYFRAGFIAQCYRYSPEAKIRAKFPNEWQLWLASLQEACAKPDRERDEYGFVPDQSIMSGPKVGYLGPGWPFPGPPGSSIL